MSDIGDAAYESVLTRGDASPKAMETLVQALIIGKSHSSSSSDSSTTDSSSSTSSSSDTPGVNPKSNQIQGDPFETQARGEFVPPRFSPEVWAAAMEQSTRLGRCIRTYARNTVGLGWFIEPIQKLDPNAPDHGEHLMKVKAQTALLHRLFNKPSKLIPTTELFFMAKVDEEATGNGYIEVVRNNARHITGLFHAPSVSVRVRVKKEETGEQHIGGYVQIRGNEKRYFKEFGDETVMNALTGDVYSGDTPLPIAQRATEILHFKLYSPTSTWYGAPRYVSAAPALSGNRLASVRNVKFFENDAVPRMALLVSGGRLTPDSINSIEDFFKAKVQGTEKAHSVVVIQTEQTKVGFQQQQDNVRLELKPLTVGVTEDASFSQYRSANDDEIREAFGIPPVFFSTESVNKASSQTSREICNEQEFEPDRLVKENIINLTIIADVLGMEEPVVRFRFERMKLTDPLDTARMDQTYASLGALTPNELRESVGKPRYPVEYKFGDKPMQVAMAELSMQLAEAIMGEFKTQIKHSKEQAAANQPPPMPGMGGGMPGMEGAPPEGQEGDPGAEPAAGEEGEAGGGGAGAGGEGGADEEWANEGSTEESSPVSDGITSDTNVNNIHSALGLSKGVHYSKIPIDTLLGITTVLMKDAKDYGKHTNIGKEEDA